MTENPPFQIPEPENPPAFDLAAHLARMHALTTATIPPPDAATEPPEPKTGTTAVYPADPAQVAPVWMVTGTEMSAEQVRRVNFDLLGLQRKCLVVKGELVREELYRTYTDPTPQHPQGVFSGLAVRIYNNYERRGGFVFKRLQTIEWLLSDGTIGTSITDRQKVYSDEAQIAEGKRRRENIVNFLTKQAVLMFGEAGGGELLVGLKLQIEKYISGVTAPLIQAVGMLDMPALDTAIGPGVTVRQYFISELTLDY